MMRHPKFCDRLKNLGELFVSWVYNRKNWSELTEIYKHGVMKDNESYTNYLALFSLLRRHIII